MGEQWPSVRGRELGRILRTICGEPIHQSAHYRTFRNVHGTATFTFSYHDSADINGSHDWSGVEILEHLEEPLSGVEGVFVRVALDRQQLDRQQVVEALREGLTVPEQLADFEETALIAATGDVVVVACLPTDRVS